jgi:hypothetical protein
MKCKMVTYWHTFQLFACASDDICDNDNLFNIHNCYTMKRCIDCNIYLLNFFKNVYFK